MRASIAATLSLCWLLSTRHALAQVSSVYLVQDSGWMEPFYTDPAAPFRPLLNALVAASHADGEVVVAGFDQDGQVPGRRSPDVLYRGRFDAARVAAAIASLHLPHQSNGHLADADFDGALVRGIDTILDGHPGIVWLVTNNRNSPNNSQRVDDNTRAFAQALGSSPSLPVVVAYPVRLPATGRLYSAQGLIVYGIAYGRQAAAALRRLTAGDGLRRLFSDPAVQLKPLDQAPLTFTPDATLTPGLVASRAPDGALRIGNVPGGRTSTVEIAGTLRSNYYPHVIDRARLSLRWDRLDQVAGGPDTPLLQAAIVPAEVHGLGPGEAMHDVRIRLDIPRIDRAPGPAGWLQKDVLLHGTLVIGLDDLALSLQDGFVAKMEKVAALDQLPGVFFDNKAVSAASASLPVILVVHYSAWPLVLALCSLSVLLLLLAMLLVLLRREREHLVSLDGQVRRVRLRPFERRRVVLPPDRAFVLRGRLVGSPRIVQRPSSDPR